MPGLHGCVRLRSGDRSAQQVVTEMLQRAPREKEQEVGGYAAGATAISVSGFAGGDPVAGTCRGQWAGQVSLLDGYVLNRDEILAQLRAGGLSVDDKQSDPSLLAALFVTSGESAMAGVDGDFNLCLVDEEAGNVRLLSSRHGSRHLYYAATEDCIVFAPHMAGLMTAVAPTVDRLALQEMFNFGYVGGDRSMLETVKLLPGATMLSITRGEWSQSCYWSGQYSNCMEGASSFDDLVDEAGAGLQASLEAFLHRFPRGAIPISGGLDSRAILAFASKRSSGLPTLHCNWYAAEAKIARQLVEAAGATWREYDPLTFDFAQILDNGARLTEGNVHCHQFWFQPLARDIGSAGETDILLDGYLMDVFFGDTFLVLPSSTDSDQHRRAVINGLWRRCRPSLVQEAFLPEFYAEYEQANRDSLSEQMARVEEANLSNFVHRFSFANRSNRYSVALPNAQRGYVDYGYPGLTHSLVDLYFRIPPQYKVSAAFSRAIIERFAPEAAAVPWAKTGRPLSQGKAWYDRLGERFPLRQAGSLALLRASGGRIDASHRADLNRHFRQHAAFRQAHLDIADDERTFSRGIIDPAGLQRLTKMIDSGWPVFFLLQSLVTVEMFHRRFVD